jgi:drug/metabolite transporter (DMT)-like permease
MNTQLPQERSLSTFAAWLALLAIGATWGSSYYVIKKALLAFDPTQIAAMRVSIAFICFLPMLIMNWKKIRRKHIKYLIVVGFCGSGFPAILFPLAQTQLTSSFTGILSSSTPIFTLSIGALFFSLMLSKSKLIGVIIGFVGAILLAIFSGTGEISGNPWYALLVLLATALYGISTNTINTFLKELDTFTISSFAFMIIGIPSIVYLFSGNFVHTLTTHPEGWYSFTHVAILAVAGTFLATLFFFQLIKSAGVVFASTVSYIIPCVAVLLGFLDGERLSVFHLLGMSLIIWGVYMTSRRT